MLKRMSIVLSLLLVACGTSDPEPEPEPAPSDEADLPADKIEAAELTNEGKGDFSLDICEWNDWYTDGECDWFCPKRDSDCNEEPLGPEPDGVATRHPIVLAHGFMGSPTNFWAFNGVADALRADGHVVYEGEVPPFHAPAVRAERLAPTIDRALLETGSSKVNIIAHSMGGVDSRYLISTLGYGDRVASLTTISSPHHGSGVADAALSLTPSIADDALNAVLRAIGSTFSNEGDEADLRAALEGIAEANMPQFNEQNADDDRVMYQSWAGISSVTGFANSDARSECEGGEFLLHDGTYDHMDALLWLCVPLVAGLSIEPNDGMSTVASSRWGTFRGCIPADHLDEVGQLDNEPDPDTGFDPIRFYRNVAFDLSSQGL